MTEQQTHEAIKALLERVNMAVAMPGGINPTSNPLDIAIGGLTALEAATKPASKEKS